MGIESYLNELCASLKVDSLRRDEIRLEVHTHLRQRAETLVREGMASDAAEHRAVAEFGDSEETAERLSAFPTAPVTWKVSRHIDILSGLLIASGFTTVASFMAWVIRHSLDLRHELSANQVLINIVCGFGYLCLKLLFGIYLYRRKRWVRLPLLISCVLIPAYYVYFGLNVVLLPENVSLGTEMLFINMMPLFMYSLYALWVLGPRRSLEALR